MYNTCNLYNQIRIYYNMNIKYLKKNNFLNVIFIIIKRLKRNNNVS